jgi:hypothetical protein
MTEFDNPRLHLIEQIGPEEYYKRELKAWLARSTP